MPRNRILSRALHPKGTGNFKQRLRTSAVADSVLHTLPKHMAPLAAALASLGVATDSRERLRRVPFKKSPVVFVCQSSSSHHHHRHLIIIIISSSSSSSHHHLIILIFSSSSHHHHHHLSPLSLLLFFSFLI